MKASKLILTAFAPLFLTQCVVLDAPNMGPPGRYPGVTTPFPPPMPPEPPCRQPLTVSVAYGTVRIREGAHTISSFRAAMPNVEETEFINGQEQIVVKSRGNHGPATVQLFDTHTGGEQDSVMAYQIRGGHPRWAAGMAE